MAAADYSRALGLGHLGGQDVFREAAVCAARSQDVRTCDFLQLFGIHHVCLDKWLRALVLHG